MELNKNIIFIIFILIILMSFYTKNESMKVNKSKKVIFYNFNTGWCYYSKILQPEWNKLQKHYSNNKKIKIIDIKCEKKENKEICKKFNVKKYPTLIKVKNGEVINYNSERKLKKIIVKIKK